MVVWGIVWRQYYNYSMLGYVCPYCLPHWVKWNYRIYSQGPRCLLRRKNRKVDHREKAKTSCWYHTFFFIFISFYEVMPGKFHAFAWVNEIEMVTIIIRQYFPTWSHVWQLYKCGLSKNKNNNKKAISCKMNFLTLTKNKKMW